MFINKVQEEYAKGNYLDGMRFSKWLNNEYLPQNPDKLWIKEVSSKAVKQSIMNGDKAFKNFFKGQAGFPRKYKKKDQKVKAYFPKNNKRDWEVERHRVKIPSLGWVRLKEYGYIPQNTKVRSGTVSCLAGRYYVSVLFDYKALKSQINNGEGIGIDLGIKNFLTLSNGTVYENINLSERIKKLDKRLHKVKGKYLRKLRINKELGISSKNLEKQKGKLQKIYHRLSNIRLDYTKQIVSDLVKAKPNYITIENLDVKGMRKNKYIFNHIKDMHFYKFKVLLLNKCKEFNIELRMVDRWYPSSQICSDCGFRQRKLKLSDRTFECTNCSLKIDRDLNASLNLKYATDYIILTN